MGSSVQNSDVRLENGIYVKMNQVEENIGKKITGKDKGENGTDIVAPNGNAIAIEMSPMELELEDQQKLSGMGGLNEGYEMEDDEPIQPILFTPAPEKTEDDIYLAAFESRITDLFYLAKDILVTGGMSKNFAMEAERILPGFGGVPLGYYSNDPSATRYKLSLEEIAKNVICLMSEADKKFELQDNEQYRLQMAGIGVAAYGYCTSTENIHPDYVTQTLKDVIKLYKKYDALFQIDPDKSVKVLKKAGLT